MSPTRAERTRNMRYKRPALASMGDEYLIQELETIQEACSDMRAVNAYYRKNKTLGRLSRPAARGNRPAEGQDGQVPNRQALRIL